MYREIAMTPFKLQLTTLCIAFLICGCGTLGGGNDDSMEAEIRQIPGKAEYTVFGPHRLRGLISISGLPEGTSEESTAAARAGSYEGSVVWTFQGGFTFGTASHKVLEPKVTVGKSKPETVEILLTVVPPAEEVTTITISRAPVTASITASPQAKFRVQVVESK